MRRFDSIVVTTSNDLNAGSFGIFEICASKWQESSTHINSSLGNPPRNMENWSKWSFIVIPNCLSMCYPPGLTCGLHTFVYHFGSIPVELTYLGIENPGWKRDGEVKKNVYGKIHDHIFIHTKVCIYMHLLYFVYCIYVLCNIYLSNICEIFFDAILYAFFKAFGSLRCMTWVPLKLLGDSMEPAELQRIWIQSLELTAD